MGLQECSKMNTKSVTKSVTKILTSYFQGIFSTSESPYNKSTPITINVHSNEAKKDPTISKNREKISPLSAILSNQKKNLRK